MELLENFLKHIPRLPLTSYRSELCHISEPTAMFWQGEWNPHDWLKLIKIHTLKLGENPITSEGHGHLEEGHFQEMVTLSVNVMTQVAKFSVNHPSPYCEINLYSVQGCEPYCSTCQASFPLGIVCSANICLKEEVWEVRSWQTACQTMKPVWNGSS